MTELISLMIIKLVFAVQFSPTASQFSSRPSFVVNSSVNVKLGDAM